MYKIEKAAVLGSGTMGAAIAAHLANVGIPTLLLDIVPKKLTEEEKKKGLTLNDKAVKNRISTQGVKRLLKQKPSPLTVKDNIQFITPGNMADDMERLSEADWIIEVVVENLDIKKQVFEQVDRYRKKGAIVSSNTSGISIQAMAEDCSDDFKRHFLGTHFFNPPRYLKLLEIIPTKDTDEKVTEFMKTFGEERLGKGVVTAKDTPNFIANRIGTYGTQITINTMLEKGYSIGEIDSVTGPLIGRAKSATFRTLDVVGLDIFVDVAKNVRQHVEEENEKRAFEIPDFVNSMLERGWLGAKTGQGFYLKQGKEIFQLNPETMDYEPREKLKAPSIEKAKQLKSTKEKIKALAFADDRAGEILWSTLKQTLLYAAEKAYEIADNIRDIDLAMKWGFGWKYGPFETWDAIGLEASIERIWKEGDTVPDWVELMLAKGFTSFYKDVDGVPSYYHEGQYVPIPCSKKHINLNLLKKEERVIKKNSGASLIDIGDDVCCLEFHSPNNAIGLDILEMIHKSVEEVEKNYKGLVIGNQSSHFCVGANIAIMLMAAQDDDFFELENVAKKFQQTMMFMKYARKPIVSAPFNMTLGGGTEVCLHTSAQQASMETYMGLVEVGVGLIPGGGGNKELYIRHLEQLPKDVPVDLTAVSNQVFKLISTAAVSSSANEAVENGFIRRSDGISVNNDHLLYDAKQKVIRLYESGYQPPAKKKIPVSGEAGYAAMLMGAKSMAMSGYASEHDLKIAEKLAKVLSGGLLPQGTEVEEQYLLDLERETFLSLIGEAKTQQRMQHMLLKGKPLRN
ncbi:3-hydroxyacyl-CoA dehydrogenase [Scopulibacillus daqui]|uniref:3-hydroxyacyl-CoA dehydrogenase n=1 Tax=Scopulibacillus daqui TaxID=1469162 RepID=A0ABS2Q287_9BACL|nr:3-hydroxyacyl-CoA dehydrogenase/enoyl-CoA hydratase family protein [Scopulibacillus daqui]MBM7646408.1 3-hydroxyacyl-CoA dehydrogenase [Scopulibacillus daqui]